VVASACSEASDEPTPAPSGRHWAWADLMRRAFDIDVLACPRCGRRLRLMATVEDPGAIRAILAAVAGSRELVERARPFTASPDPGPSDQRLSTIFRLQPLGDLHLRGVEPGTTAHGVDGLEAAGGDEPGARIGRHALARPLLDRRGEGFVKRLLCEFEAAAQTDERGEDAARFSSCTAKACPSRRPRSRRPGADSGPS